MLTRQAANMASSDKLIEIREGDALDILLQNQHLDWSLVRLPFVKEGPCKGNIKVNLYDMPGSSITNSDIAAFLIVS
ncbi:hypothetical protein [Paenibacillus thiaminolyticus]|uniref:hypothetical protein n=1 Tax=Paenibacillus thiaminolyticus TaxID=49283 RepID=UPI0021757B4E|nr:hypothetical protein [Paenibacillus thiaminolyticus]